MAAKSVGVTETERLLAEFCERTFLKLWAYPNPFKDDGHELCDLLAVFGDEVFVFFDREKQLPESSDKDQQILWDRWKRNVIDRQVKTAHGAERYIRSARSIFVDNKCSEPLPIPFNLERVTVHKIIIAHGARDACKSDSPSNVYGSLAVTYSNNAGDPTVPFHLVLDKLNPVHVLDSHNMPIVLSELDTVADFSRYLKEKVRAISRYDLLSYCGEEDLLAHYLWNFDSKANAYIIGTNDDTINSVHIGEGEWSTFITTDTYRDTKNADKISYFWDDLIQRTCQNSLDGTLGGNSNISQGQSAIFEMVKEPRFVRRALSERMLKTVERFPDHKGKLTRQVTFLPSFYDQTGYVLLQLRVSDELRNEPDFREKRLFLLEIACAAAKSKFPDLKKVLGIGIENPKFTQENTGEDFILMPCEDWPDEMKQHYEELNQEWQFFATTQLEQFNEHVTAFVTVDRHKSAATAPDRKPGRNKPCLWATPRTCSFLAGLEMLMDFGGCPVYPATIVT